MDRIAFIIGETFIYWSSIVLTLASAVSVCLFLAFYFWKDKNAMAAAAVIPLSIVLSLVFARFMHWYCRSDSYVSFHAAMTNYGSGGYALMGVFAGCALAAVIVRAAGISRNLPHMLDCMSLAGCGGIAVGRLACFFNTQDRGQIIQSVQNLPWVYPVTNSVSGIQEFRLATFVIQAMVTGVIFLALLAFAILTWRRRKKGDVTLVFLLLYCASQVVLDSTRYDSLFFRSNGFVSITQVLSAMGLGLGCIVFSIRLVKRNQFRSWYIALWAAFAGLMGLGGYMEYYVQRHGDQPVFAYTWMTTALVGIVSVVMAIYFLSGVQLKPVPPKAPGLPLKVRVKAAAHRLKGGASLLSAKGKAWASAAQEKMQQAKAARQAKASEKSAPEPEKKPETQLEKKPETEPEKESQPRQKPAAKEEDFPDLEAEAEFSMEYISLEDLNLPEDLFAQND